MSLPAKISHTMTSVELLDLVNEARSEFGESLVRHNDFLARCKDELDGEYYETFVIKPEGPGRPSEAIRLNRDQCMLVAMRESKGVRRKVVEKLNELDQVSTQLVIPQSLPEALRLAADLAEENEDLKLLTHQQAVKIDSLTSQFMEGETPPTFAKRLNGVNVQMVNARLMELGWLYDSDERPDRHHYRAASVARDRWLTESPLKLQKQGSKSRIKYSQVLLLAGAERLFELYLKQQLPMKATWDGRFSHVKFPRSTQ